MPWPLQKPATRQSPSAVCSKLGALQDAECVELLRETEEYEARRILKEGKIQVSQPSVPIVPKPPTALCLITKFPFLFSGVGYFKDIKISIFSDHLPI